MPGAQQQPKPTHPSRSHSLSSASSSFLSRLSSRTLSSLSPSTTTPTSFSPRSSIITLIVTLLSLLASNSNSLSRSQASQFVTTLDAIGFYDLKIAQDVRQGVQTGFGRGGEELVTYLRWVEGELRRGGSGELEGGGLSSWGWDVSRIIPILHEAIHTLDASPGTIVDLRPLVDQLEPLDQLTARALETVFREYSSSEEKRERVWEMVEDLETTVRMFWSDHSQPLYHLSTFSFYIGLSSNHLFSSPSPYLPASPSEEGELESYLSTSGVKFPFGVEDEDEADGVVEFEGVQVLTMEGEGEREERRSEAWWL